MTEPKNENKEVAIEETNGLFNYPNKLPDNLTNKDINYLRKRIDGGLPTDNPKSERIKSAIESFIEKTETTDRLEYFFGCTLVFIFFISLSIAFDHNKTTIGTMLFPYAWSLLVMITCITNYESTLAALDIIDNKYSKSIFSIIKRNTTPLLAFLIPLCLFYYIVVGHEKEPASVLDISIALVIIILAHTIRTTRKRMIQATLKKYKIGE